MFHSLLADVVFWTVLALVWAACWLAKPPPGLAPASRFAEYGGRAVAATLLTAVLGVLPALVAAALVGGRLA